MDMHKQEEQKTDVADDPKARAVLRQAFEKSARWPEDFKGFMADLTVNVNGKEVRGSVTVKGPRDVSVSLPDSNLQKWAEGQIAMIAVHRGARSFDSSDGKHPLTLGDDPNHPLGQTLFIHGDGMQSSYRVKGDRITQINRKMPRTAFTINVEESALTQDNKFITTRYTVYYFSPQDGKLANAESFTDTHTRLGAADLPATRRIISYENNAMVTKVLTFEHHKPL